MIISAFSIVYHQLLGRMGGCRKGAMASVSRVAHTVISDQAGQVLNKSKTASTVWQRAQSENTRRELLSLFLWNQEKRERRGKKRDTLMKPFMSKARTFYL